MTRRYSSPSLADAAKQLRTLSISCERCNRFGRYRIDKLIEQYGPDISLPDLRHELAQCERRHNMSDPCQVGYVERVNVDPETDRFAGRNGRGLGCLSPSGRGARLDAMHRRHMMIAPVEATGML